MQLNIKDTIELKHNKYTIKIIDLFLYTPLLYYIPIQGYVKFKLVGKEDYIITMPIMDFTALIEKDLIKNFDVMSYIDLHSINLS